MKKIAIIVISLIVLSGMAFAREFPDVESSHWAHQYIDYLSNNGVINGYEDGTYRPQNSVTRAEFLKLLICSDSKVEREANELVQHRNVNKWYDAYVCYINENNLSSYDFAESEFDEPITRVEITTFIKNFGSKYGFVDDTVKDEDVTAQVHSRLISIVLEKKLSKKKNITFEEAMEIVRGLKENEKNEILSKATEGITVSTSRKVTSFSDVDNLVDAENNAIYETEKLGIINGYEDGSFKPNNNVTRAEVSAIMYRWINLLKEKGIR